VDIKKFSGYSPFSGNRQNYSAYRPLLDSVGLTLLYCLAIFSSLGVAFLAVEIMFTRLMKARIINPSTSLLGRACQPDLALWYITQFISNSLSFTIEEFPLAFIPL
jgi:Flp pilus assembly protein protease CpaA